MPYNVTIIEDEPLGITVLESYLENEKQFYIAASFTDPEEAIVYLKAHSTDVLLLDINMPMLNGFQLLERLTASSFLTIVTTAHKKYLQEGFDHGVLDYLQKPIKKDRFKQALSRAQQALEQRNFIKETQHITSEVLYIKSGRKEFYIRKENILYIKGLKDYCTLYLNCGNKITVLGSLKNFLVNNNKDNWLVRVHKSYAIPIKNITEVLSATELYIQANRIPIGRKYKNEFLGRFRKNASQYINHT
jgi:two-component system LytT family response regulator